jgi:hypothetical protein
MELTPDAVAWLAPNARSAFVVSDDVEGWVPPGFEQAELVRVPPAGPAGAAFAPSADGGADLVDLFRTPNRASRSARI